MFRLLRPFEFHEPASVEEAVALLSTYGDGARVLAGGTDLVVSMKKRELGPEHVIAISQLAELDFMELDADGSLRLGPLVTHAAIARSPIVREHFAMLATACNEVGTPQIRNMGTIGGNVCKVGSFAGHAPRAGCARGASSRWSDPWGSGSSLWTSSAPDRSAQ